MNLVQGIVVVCLFLLGLCAIEHWFRKSSLPYICWMVLFGVGYGMLQDNVSFLPQIHLSSDVILFIFLPLLIFDSSRKIKLNLGRNVLLPSALLASVGIIASMYLMALPILVLSDIPWNHILLFTAIMSATDPVAVSAIFSQFPVPERLRTLLEGESLLNDGTTVILFTLLSHQAVEGHPLILQKGILFFIIAVAGALLIGVAAGIAGAWLMARWKALSDHFVGVLLPLLIVYPVFCFTQRMLDISGVIAVMAATMTMRYMLMLHWKSEVPVKSELDFYRDFWTFLGDLANAVLFFVLGVEIGLHSGEIAWKVLIISLVALLFARSTVVYAFGAVFRLLRIKIPVSWLHVLNLGGLKGALSVALILMLPKDYIYRDIFLYGALVMCIFTLVANTIAMRVYLKKADLSEAG